MAERTGLEPATPGVTGRYSNRLNYRSKNTSWWVLEGSNLRPSPCKGDALPAELSTPGISPLFYRVFEAFASLECRSLRRLDLNRFAGGRIAARASGSLLDREGAESNQRHSISLLQSLGDGID